MCIRDRISASLLPLELPHDAKQLTPSTAASSTAINFFMSHSSGQNKYSFLLVNTVSYNAKKCKRKCIKFEYLGKYMNLSAVFLLQLDKYADQIMHKMNIYAMLHLLDPAEFVLDLAPLNAG